MIKKAMLSACSVVVLGGCQGTISEKFDTVTIRHADMSCTENIRIDNNGQAGLTYYGPDSRLQFNLNAPVPVPGEEFVWSKPCRELLADMNAVSEAETRAAIAEAEVRERRAHDELKLMDGGAHTISHDF